MNNPKISIIVPVYKSELTINRCVNSILQQPYQNWELILVDDGSPDDSGKLCDCLSIKDSRIKVFHKINEGVSLARNMGLDNASGEWVTFIDSDDWLEGDVLSIVKNEDIDSKLVVFDCVDVFLQKFEKHHYQTKVLRGEEYKKTFYQYMFNPVFLGPWSKFFRRDIIENYNIRFDPTIKWAEDRLFNMMFISHIDNIKFAGYGDYMYLQPTLDQNIMKYNVSIKMISDLYDEMRKVVRTLKFKHKGYAYSVFWQNIEKICLLDPTYNESERKLFYKKNFTLRTLLDMKWYHIPPFIMCAIFPHEIYKRIIAKYLRVRI